MNGSFWDRHALPGFLNGEQKDELVTSGETFRVIGVRKTASQYGEQWVVNIVRDQRPNASIGFSANEWRDEFFGDLQGELRTNGPIAAVLRSFETPMGTGYTLGPPAWYSEQEHQSELPPVTDDVPF